MISFLAKVTGGMPEDGNEKTKRERDGSMVKKAHCFCSRGSHMPFCPLWHPHTHVNTHTHRDGGRDREIHAYIDNEIK